MDPTTITTVTTAATAWLWKRYSNEIANILIRQASKLAGSRMKAAWEAVDWELAAARYNQKIKQLYGTTRALGKPDPIPLEGIFTDVYILDKPSAFNRFDITQIIADPELPDKTHERIHGLSLIAQPKSDRLYILGKPGAGKTTFLKYLVLQAADGNLDRIPVFVSLKEWSDSQLELLPFLARQFDICGFPDALPFVERILEKGDAIVLFDGLDEVKQEHFQRDKTISVLRDFTNKYNAIQCLITCRIAATDYSFDKFYYVELADFTDAQIRVYVNRWFQNQPEKKALFFVEFDKFENRNLRELARIPLLLGLLCLAFDELMYFPPRRVEIYEEAVEALLKRWDNSRAIQRDYQGLEPGRKRQMFALIASKTFQENQYFLPERKLAHEIVNYLATLPKAPHKASIDGVEVLKAIEAQHGIFSERAAKIYSFSHLTFQEYFTARHIVYDGASVREIRGLLTAEKITDPRWREVILMTASLLGDADEFFVLMQRAIDSLVVGDKVIRRLVNQAHSKSLALHRRSGPSVIRLFYAFLGLGQTLDLPRTLVIALAQDLTRTINLDLECAHALDLERALEHNQDLDHALIRALACAPDRALTLALTLTRRHALILARILADSPIADDTEMCLDFHLDLLLRYAWYAHFLPIDRQKYCDYFELIKQEIQRRGESILFEQIAMLKAPQSTNNLEWKEFAAELRGIIQEERGIGYQHDFTENQCRILEKYFKASQLLLSALDVAAVRDRQKIKNRLLVPSS